MSAGGNSQLTTPQPQDLVGPRSRHRRLSKGGFAIKLGSRNQQSQSNAHVSGVWLGPPVIDQLNETIQVIIRAELAAE